MFSISHKISFLKFSLTVHSKHATVTCRGALNSCNKEKKNIFTIPSPAAINDNAWAGDRTTSSFTPSTKIPCIKKHLKLASNY